MATPILILCWLLTADAAGGISSSQIDAEVKKIRDNRVACGPLSTWYCLARFGKVMRADSIIHQAKLDADGMSASRLVALCRSFGLSARAIAGPRHRLYDLPIPAILFLDDRHCVVYDGEGENKTYESVRVFEPVTRHVGDEDANKLRDHWTGEAIVFAEIGPSPMRLYAVSLVAAAIMIAAVHIFGRLRRLIAPGAGETNPTPTGSEDVA